MLTILIADDNRQISSILSEYAKKEGYHPILVHDGEEALERFRQGDIDLLLLDVMMPKMDGFEVCREIRRVSTIPIIMITARGEDFERIMGLDIGADDYIVKPFSPGEVMARVRAVLRRVPIESAQGKENNTVQIANLTIQIERYQVLLNEEPVPLTKKEMELLYTMACNPERVYTRDMLLDQIWGYDYYGDTRTVDSHIKRLRAKLDVAPHPEWEIVTIWGVGYKFEVREHEE